MKLSIDSIFKQFGERKILQDVYIACKTGEVVGLLGLNGSGKSTLLKIVMGLDISDHRHVKVDDKVLLNASETATFLAYLPQQNFLPSHLRLKTIISLCCNDSDATIIKEHPVIKPLLNEKAKYFSGGETRLIEVLLVLHSKAPFLLLDEPFNGIAPVYKEEIVELIHKKSKTKGIIVSDHDYRTILKVCNKLVVLRDGKTNWLKNKEELVSFGYLNETHKV